MLVRLKKRGEFPAEHSQWGSARRISSGLGIGMFRGCCIEVEPAGETWPCGSEAWYITDERLLALYETQSGFHPSICAHYLIDDLEAYDSDFCDEQAEVGDLAFAQVPVRTL